MTKRILITGGNGYIGSALAFSLARKYNVTIIDKQESLLVKGLPITFYQTDIFSKQLEKIFLKEKFDLIFHLAALIDVKDSEKIPEKYIHTNIEGSARVFKTAIKYGAKIVFFSTVGVYGDSLQSSKQTENQPVNPSSIYAWTKYTSEILLDYFQKRNQLESIILRIANLYGSGGISRKSGVINTLVKQISKKNPITITGDGSQTRDFLYIDDLIDLCKLIVKIDAFPVKNIFNVGSGEETSINGIVSLIAQNLQISPVIINTENPGQKRSSINIEKIVNKLHWQPKTSLKEGIKQTITHFNK